MRIQCPVFSAQCSVSGLYAIVDSVWDPLGSLPELASRFLEGGCRIIQLRMKPENREPGPEIRKRDSKKIFRFSGPVSRVSVPETVLKTAGEIMKLKKRWNFTFVINDHADIAMEVGADGVHVGENDESVASIKKHHGSNLIVGYSSHSIDEARRAEGAGADYIAFGAIFPTKTKGPGHPVQGLDKLREVVRAVKVPVVAIGGIGRNNIQSVIETGASAVAMISALAEAKDIVVETKWFVSVYPNCKTNGLSFPRV